MTDQEYKDWLKLAKQFKNGYHLSKNDWKELLRLNHLLMELSHKIHNENQMKGR